MQLSIRTASARLAGRRHAVLLLAVAWLASGCALLGAERRDALQPGVATDAVVGNFAWRGDYLDVSLETAGHAFRFMFPASPECFALFRGSEPLRFVQEGQLGRVEAGDGQCPVIGVLSLRAWMDHGPVALDEAPVEPSEVRFQVTDQDREIFLAVGDFALAPSVGWNDLVDVAIVLPNDGDCRLLNVFASGVLEFHPGAAVPLVVTNQGRSCPVLGFTHRYRRDAPKSDG